MLFRKKQKITPLVYDREHQVPALRRSICTGEQTAGFLDKRTGRFQAVERIGSQADLDRFLQACGTDALEVIY